MQPVGTKIGDGQHLIKSITGSATFCALPWIHLATRPNGDMRLCCGANASGAGDDHIVGLVKNDNGKPANFGTDTPMSAWNNEYMRNVRQAMTNSEIPKSCTKCFEEESNGVVSKRLWEMYDWANEGLDFKELLNETSSDGSVPEKIQYLDLRLGHTCNLKCSMCSPHDSSRWVQDHEKLVNTVKSTIILKQIDWDKNSFNNQWYMKKEFWDDINQQIPNVKKIYFAGGEPLMIKEHKIFLEEIIKRGYAKDISLRYNSNGVLLTDDILEIWSHFKKVNFALSIDSISDRNHYIRYPTEWEEVLTVLKKLDNTPDNIIPSIQVAVQVLNIEYLPEFAKFILEQNFKKVNKHSLVDYEAGGGIFNMHLLYIPTFMSARILPKEHKDRIKVRFAEFKEWLLNNYRQDTDFWETNPYGWARWEAILNFIDSEDHSNLLPDFKEYINNLDTIRDTDAKAIFPELSYLL